MFTIVFDTVCQGLQSVKDEDGPVMYGTEAEAQAEIDSDPEFYQDCSVVPMEEIGHKTIWYPSPPEG